jgi:hypothetical protein
VLPDEPTGTLTDPSELSATSVSEATLRDIRAVHSARASTLVVQDCSQSSAPSMPSTTLRSSPVRTTAVNVWQQAGTRKPLS